MKKVILFTCLMCLAAIPFAVAKDNPLVYVSILPQRTFVKHISGDLVDVSVMVMPGASPATYEPSPGQMTELSMAAAYFSIGVPFESTWLPRISAINSKMSFFATDENIRKWAMAAHQHASGHHHGDHHDAHGHQHDKGHGHEDRHKDDRILDPHIWLDPVLVKIQARTIRDGLVKIDPSNKAIYDQNLKDFLNELDGLDDKIRAMFTSLPEDKRSFMVFHPAWGYFARQYDLNQVPIESEGKQPSPKELAEIVRHGRELGITAVFVQPQFSDKSAQVIAREMGARVVELDPLAENWSENLLHAARALKQALN